MWGYAEIVDDPAHLVFYVTKDMVGHKIEVLGRVSYTDSSGVETVWFPNLGQLAALLSSPGMRKTVAKLMRMAREVS